MIRISSFTKSYNGRIVLRIDDFVIPPGVYWVRGHNGSGKSTLLKSIAGITPFKGSIIINEQLDVKKHPASYRSIVNFAEAEPIFPDFLTGTELVQLFKSAKNAPSNQADFYIKSMNISEFMDEQIHTYSSGMLKKLSLVLAFMGQPSYILLDEPLTTLDAESLPILYKWIANLHAQKATTFLLSSHQAFEGDILPTVQKIVVEQTLVRHSL
jgi:ABC-2 type transport system ATP-binding protein